MKKNLVESIGECGVPRGNSLAVACSGGADSMALALAAAAWSRESGSELTVITIDHRLRSESQQEAQQVALWMAARGIRHVVIAWEGGKPRANRQEAAREARYRLLREYCSAQGIADVLVAHHRDDQAETFLLRLARGSGVDGLAGMAGVTPLGEITLRRPFLNIPKADLIAYLQENNQEYIHDPSNDNPDYARVRIRAALPHLATLGLSVDRLVATAASMRRARTFLEAQTEAELARQCRWFPEGYAMLALAPWEEELGLRVLASALMGVGGHVLRPRLAELERLYHAIHRPGFEAATLAGCIFRAYRGKILICREQKAIAPPCAAEDGVWDGRFRLHSPLLPGWTVGALTVEGWRELSGTYGVQAAHVPHKRIVHTLPAWRDTHGKLMAVPHLGWNRSGQPLDAVFTRARSGQE